PILATQAYRKLTPNTAAPNTFIIPPLSRPAKGESVVKHSCSFHSLAGLRTVVVRQSNIEPEPIQTL
ncbi:MAG: hypothetical protein JWO80_5119, partial [Bryobacterales bacterium]|nr:hypothetical protein [Bryobacterales bacterium]